MPDKPNIPAKPTGKPDAGKAAGGVKGKLTQKVGPLPVWGWAAIGAGGLIAWSFLRGGGSAESGEYGVAGLGSLAGGGGGSGGSGGGSGSVVPLPEVELPEVTAPEVPPLSTTNGTPTFVPGTDTIDAIAEQVQAEYQDSGYTPPTTAVGPFPSVDAYPAGNIGSPQQLLDALKTAAASGIGQISFTGPSGVTEYMASNPLTIQNVEQNILASGAPPTITSQPIGTVSPISAPSPTSPPVDYSKAISTLEGYITNLQTGDVTQADRDKIALYQARIREYSSR